MDFYLLNAQQRAAVEYNGKHLMVLAGAGTGKTRTIGYNCHFWLAKSL